jgi:hypothetical protein
MIPYEKCKDKNNGVDLEIDPKSLFINSLTIHPACFTIDMNQAVKK